MKNKLFHTTLCLFLSPLFLFNLTIIPDLKQYAHLAPDTAMAQEKGKLSRDEVKEVLLHKFFLLDGTATLPTMVALMQGKVFDLYQKLGDKISVEDVVKKLRGNKGYVRVAFRQMRSNGWMQMSEDPTGIKIYTLTDEGAQVLKILSQFSSYYEQVFSFLPFAMKMEDHLLDRMYSWLIDERLFKELVTQSRVGWNSIFESYSLDDELKSRLKLHLDGILVGSVMVALGRNGIFKQMLENDSLDLDQIRGHEENIDLALDLLENQGWVQRKGDVVVLTPQGRYAAKKATSNGVPLAYLATYNVLPTLLFGNAKSIQKRDQNGKELLVDRPMNVWGSGGAHERYFTEMDKIILEIFNRPLDQQPKGICDMGCGNGAFLKHLYEFIIGKNDEGKYNTLRGKYMAENPGEYPLKVVGADFNEDSRVATRNTLEESKIPSFHVINGNINDPDQLAANIEKLGFNIKDFLHVRSFLDHNRIYEKPEGYQSGSRKSTTTGAFAYFGEEIPADELEENLVRHLKKWEPYVRRYGLLVLELHTLPPELIAQNLGKTLAIPYDTTHGYSDQYLVEIDVWLRLALEAGLKAVPRYQSQFPRNELATISINYFTSKTNSLLEPPAYYVDQAI